MGCLVMCDVVVGGWGGVVCGGLRVYGYDGVSTRTPTRTGTSGVCGGET